MTEEATLEYEIGREQVPDIDQGEPQTVKVEVIVVEKGSQYGTQRIRVLAEFRRSESEDGFNWANGTPVRYTEEEDEPNLSFHTYHILGIERAVEYIEEHYGSVTSGYPSMVQ
jgi:hypothetical protein